MKRWSHIRSKLENEYLAESLRGHITYFATSYSKCPDHEGRAAIRLDGEEILKSSYYERMAEHSRQFHHLYDNGEGSMGRCWMMAFDEAEKNGEFDQKTFYRAFSEFESNSIDESLASEYPLVRIFAVLDRRCGKRRIRELLSATGEDDALFLMFLIIRAEAEGIYIREDTMDKIWEEMYAAAKAVLAPRRISEYVTAGEVSAAVLSKSGKIYTGVCIDTCSTLGICAERNAIFSMITNGEQEIDKVLCIPPVEGRGAPCGACRELMVQLMPDSYKDIEIMIDYKNNVVMKLGELTPEWWI